MLVPLQQVGLKDLTEVENPPVFSLITFIKPVKAAERGGARGSHRGPLLISIQRFHLCTSRTRFSWRSQDPEPSRLVRMFSCGLFCSAPTGRTRWACFSLHSTFFLPNKPTHTICKVNYSISGLSRSSPVSRRLLRLG